MNSFLKKLNRFGIKGSIMPIDALENIENLMNKTAEKYPDISINLKKYIDKFEYGTAKNSKEFKSIIILAVKSPVTKIFFTQKNKIHIELMPPMYLYDCSVENESKQINIEKITNILNSILHENNFKAVKSNLPCKALAVLSGLAKYGKNNLCYVEEFGSYIWLGAYLSDCPAEKYIQPKEFIMKECESCNLCEKNCPSGAISSQRFPIHHNKCITYFNESENLLPNWINPLWHNALIGCMRCQIVCPKNKNLITKSPDSILFSEEETDQILNGVSIENLTSKTLCKLKAINFLENYTLLSRNLKLLLEKSL